jgi:hypothetical protein
MGNYYYGEHNKGAVYTRSTSNKNLGRFIEKFQEKLIPNQTHYIKNAVARAQLVGIMTDAQENF